MVLGSTGSIGSQALSVIREHREHFSVVGLAAGGWTPEFRTQADEFRPALLAVARPPDGSFAPPGLEGRWFAGPEAATELVREATRPGSGPGGPDGSEPDVVLVAIPGLAGLRPALAALELPVILGLASKEPVVAAGHLLLEAAGRSGAAIVPVDSEPAALAQCLAGRPAAEVERAYLTASGGPFWGQSQDQLARVPASLAVRHPRWRMGPKISVDSATLFNKGLEVIEVSRLFGWPVERIEILVHRQSAIHAMIEHRDGSIQAQLAPADMRIPISSALFWPHRAPRAWSRLDLAGMSLDFERPDLAAWPCLAAALSAGAAGGLQPAVISAADEVLVGAYLAGQVEFGQLGEGLWAILGQYRDVAGPPPSLGLDQVLAADQWARCNASRWVARHGTNGGRIVRQGDCR